MNFAPVLPPELYPLLDTGDYHLVNAYQISHNIRILQWFSDRVRRGHTVILDNGAHELGVASAIPLFEVAKQIHPSVVICPDVIRDAVKTKHLMFTHLKICIKYAQSVMIVPQGRSVDEWIECTHDMLCWSRNYLDSPVIGVPKTLDGYDGGRVKALRHLTHVLGVPQEQIHLLGIWQTVRDVVEICRQFPHLAGVDSTLPFATALAKLDFKLDSRKTGLDANDFKMTADINWMLHARAVTNIERMQEWISQ